MLVNRTISLPELFDSTMDEALELPIVDISRRCPGPSLRDLTLCRNTWLVRVRLPTGSQLQVQIVYCVCFHQSGRKISVRRIDRFFSGFSP
jgi:hypothetical protein